MSHLPEHTVRVSHRAKHARIRVSVHDGLVVVIPSGFDPAEIPALLDEKRDWIDRSMARVAVLRAESPTFERPAALELRAVGEQWKIEWDQVAGRGAVTREFPGSRLLVHGDAAVPELWQPLLREWVMRQARHALVPWVTRLASEHGFVVPRISIRCQRTRWGSYSRRGTLSLNAQLLFLPPVLVEYVLLHELCHTVHLNHSGAFWDLLEAHEPHARRNRRDLRAAWRFVPPWLIQPR